jgi:hypothetical protein
MRLGDFYEKVRKVENIIIWFVDKDNKPADADIEVLDYPYSEPMDSKATLGDLIEQRIEPCLIFASKKLENCTIKVLPNFLKL